MYMGAYQAMSPDPSFIQFKVSPPKRKRRGTGTCKPSVKEPPPCGCPGESLAAVYLCTYLTFGNVKSKIVSTTIGVLS